MLDTSVRVQLAKVMLEDVRYRLAEASKHFGLSSEEIYDHIKTDLFKDFLDNLGDIGEK